MGKEDARSFLHRCHHQACFRIAATHDAVLAIGDRRLLRKSNYGYLVVGVVDGSSASSRASDNLFLVACVRANSQGWLRMISDVASAKRHV